MLKRYLFSFVLILLFVPALQKWFNVVTLPKLNGDFKEPERPHFTKADWYNGKFQEAYSLFLEQKTGFHNLLVRINNQYNFNFFRQATAMDVVIGKDDYLLGEGYIRAYLGNDFIGELAVDKKLRRLKFLQELLKKKGKDLIYVFEPGKVSYFPEKIPDNYYIRYPKKRSNYQAFTERAATLGIRYIDMNKWFVGMKKTTPYPLYPKNGIHWSAYGAYKAADSLIKYIEKVRNIDLPEMVLDSIHVTKNINTADYDAASTLNLLCRLGSFPMAYPAIRFPVLPDKQRVSVLTVGDSYYWNIYNTQMPNHVFNNQAFWYFNALVYPEAYTRENMKTDSLDMLKEVEKNDVIFLMVTELWLSKFDFNFIDKLFDLYTPELEPDYPYLYEGKIRVFSDWFDLVAGKAVRNRQKLEDVLHNDALYTFKNEMKEKYLLRFGPGYYKSFIESDKVWYSKEKEKAAKYKVSLDKVINGDCWYLYQKEFPEQCRQYTASIYITAALKKDPVAMQKIIHNPWYLRPEEMLWQVAIAKARGGPQFLALMTW